MYPLSREIYEPAKFDASSAFGRAVANVLAGGDVALAARSLYGVLTPAERLSLLHGNVRFWPGRGRIMEHGYNYIPFVMGELPKHGIPGIHFIDGPRGAVVGKTTAFPVSIARGATWDTNLEERVGNAIGREVRATGGNLFGGVCINLPRHPAWGRIQETYSDQPVLLGEFGAALVRGVKPNAMSCVKHYALNSMENARFDVDVQCDEATMHEHFLPHFQQAIAAGAESVMCAYNSVNGHWASASAELLNDILRDTWGFEGFTMSDFIWAIRDVTASLEAGMDLEAPFSQLRGAHLADCLERGEITWEVVDQSALRILQAQIAHYATRDPHEPDSEIIGGAEHRRLAHEVAARSMVLLQNRDEALPAPVDTVSKIAVLGRLSAAENLGDKGSSNVKPAQTRTVLEGVKAKYPAAEILHYDGSDSGEAVRLAANADLALVVVGYTAAEEGEWVNGRVYARDDLMRLYPEPETDEDRAVLQVMLDRLEAAKDKPEIGGDRKSLRLLPQDEELILAVSAVQPRTVAVLQTAGAVLTTSWEHAPAAIVLMWYAGMEGGAALADLISGDADFTGRLPFVMVEDEADLPDFDIFAKSITYDRWFSHRLLTRDGKEPAYPLGYGHSYRAAKITAIGAPEFDDELTGRVQVLVENSHQEPVQTTVQLYGLRLDGTHEGERELLGFASVQIPAASTHEVDVAITLRPLAAWDTESKAFVLAAAELDLEAASFWGDPAAPTIRHHIN